MAVGVKVGHIQLHGPEKRRERKSPIRYFWWASYLFLFAFFFALPFEDGSGYIDPAKAFRLEFDEPSPYAINLLYLMPVAYILFVLVSLKLTWPQESGENSLRLLGSRILYRFAFTTLISLIDVFLFAFLLWSLLPRYVE